MKRVETLKELIKYAFSEERGLVKLELGEIKDVIASTIEESTGFKLENYVHVVDNYAIRHTIAEHGSPQKEAKRGQIAIEVNDFKLISEIITSPDAVYYEKKNNLGLPVLIYEKTICDKIFYLEEIRTGRKELAMQTMYKRKTSTRKK